MHSETTFELVWGQCLRYVNVHHQDVLYFRFVLMFPNSGGFANPYNLSSPLSGSSNLICKRSNLNSSLTPPENAAYHCGRLLAELEAIQKTAQGNINATLVDRYYGAASSTPAKAFAPLMRGVQTHLSKLRKNSPGLYKLCDQHLEEIMLNFHDNKFPSTLAMSDQAIFALGYYHQRAANRAAIAKAKADKAEKAAAATATV
jgi:hypothetical protein